MKQKEIIKVDQTQPDDFDFKPKNIWLKIPWYFLGSILIIVVLISGALLYQYINASQQVITENKDNPPGKISGQISGITMTPQAQKEKEQINILLLGNGGANHAGGALTDVIQVLSINPKKNKALMFSIPRDFYLDIKGFGWHKINTAYYLGESKGHGKGGELIKDEVEKILDIPIHYYAKVDFEGFVRLVNILNGVEICVEQSINDPQHSTRINTGCQDMNGDQALDYVRSRYTTSDFDRSRRQQKVLVAVKKKMLQLNFLLNPIKINQALSILVGHFNTDIKVSEIKKLFPVVKDLEREKISSYVLDNRKDELLYSTIKNGAYVLLPYGGKYNRIQKLVKEKLP